MMFNTLCADSQASVLTSFAPIYRQKCARHLILKANTKEMSFSITLSPAKRPFRHFYFCFQRALHSITLQCLGKYKYRLKTLQEAYKPESRVNCPSPGQANVPAVFMACAAEFNVFCAVRCLEQLNNDTPVRLFLEMNYKFDMPNAFRFSLHFEFVRGLLEM